MEGIKYCEDCKYFYRPLLEKIFPGFKDFARCIRPNLGLVYRSVKASYTFCRHERLRGTDNCGPEGKYYASL